MRRLFAFALFAAIGIAIPLAGQEQPAAKKVLAKRHTGLVVPADFEWRVAKSWQRHEHHLQTMPKITTTSWDSRTQGIVGPVVNQMDCGDCHLFSADDVCTTTLIKAGNGKPDGSFRLSDQYSLDCIANGGCDGGWPETTVAQAKTNGIPIEADYGKYTGSPGDCRYKAGMKLYQIADYGYVGNDSSVPSVQKIKDAIAKFGSVSVAVAVDDPYQLYAGGVFRDTGYTTVNHAVTLIGWDDSKGAKGCWLLRNQWTTRWGDNGYMWIEYGANRVGFAALWVAATPLPPIPPGPTPPLPPAPIPSKLFTLTYPHNVKLGQTVHSFKAPCDIPAGTYYVVPASPAVTPMTPDPAIVIPSK